MKRIYTLLLLLVSFQSFSQNNYIVILDPGHGGHDSGAIGYGNILEKDITLAIALKVKGELYKKGITTVLTRQTDIFVPLKPLDKRSQIANFLNASVFISIHLNAGSFSGAGAECYISKYKEADENKRKSVILSELILNGMKKELGFKNRGTQFADFSVLRNTIEYTPSILLEIGFISNKSEMEFILGHGANQLSKIIADAIEQFKTY